MSRERRFFVPELDSDRIELEGAEAHHLRHVLRLTTGDEVALFDGRGRAVAATITRIAGDVVSLHVGEPLPSRESALELAVAIAIPKGDKMALAAQKLTELGVGTIIPLLTVRGEVTEPAARRRTERWRRVALEAAKQCGRARLPRVESPKPFAELARAGSLLLTPGAPPLGADEKLPLELTLLVGPEGGWSEDELALAGEKSVRMFSLGPRVLRTETAAIAAATLLQWLAGDLGR